MALSHIAAAATLAFAASAGAQAPAPAPAQAVTATPPAPESEIVVTGVRPLVVDIEKVARGCVACRRALARLEVAAAPRRTRDGGAPRSLDDGPVRAPDLGFNPPVNTSTASARGMIAYSEVQTRARITSRAELERPRPDAAAMAERYLQNLMTYVGPIIDREIQARGAPAAYASEDPAVRNVTATDISDAVIEHLDRDHSEADLLAGPRPG